MAYFLIALLFILCAAVFSNSLIEDTGGCSIRDYERTDFEGQQIAGPPSFTKGFFSYVVPCRGTVTSIRARGFCPIGNNRTTVVMQIFNSTIRDHRLVFNDTNLTVECNTSAAVGSDHYEGYINAYNLSITVESRGHLGLRRFYPCSPYGCFFQPAIVNKSSDFNLYSYTENLEESNPGVSLLFSATIISESEGEAEDHVYKRILAVSMTLGAMCVLFCVAVTFVVFKVLKRRRAKENEEKPSSYDYDEENGIKLGPVASARHNEFENNDEPFWMPASVEKELKKQLKDVIISPEGLFILDELGSLVRRGVWSVGGEEREVVEVANEAYWKVERKRGNELLKISNRDPPPPPTKPEEMMYEVVLSPAPSSRPLPTIPFPLSGGTEEEDCTTAVYEVIPGDH